MKARLEGAAQRLAREHDERAWLAWHAAFLPRAKRPPKLKDLQAPKAPKVQAADAMIAAAAAWHAAITRSAGVAP